MVGVVVLKLQWAIKHDKDLIPPYGSITSAVVSSEFAKILRFMGWSLAKSLFVCEVVQRILQDGVLPCDMYRKLLYSITM